ncbi:hypothetical protein TNCV_981551 [Trichonephila clavipes]|nr:hypothetical protein TNCV_981551 [Trichonephila clavipes]
MSDYLRLYPSFPPQWLDSLRVSGEKAIFESSAAIEFIFEAVPRVNSRLVKLTTLIVKGERFKIGQKDHCSHGRVQNH